MIWDNCTQRTRAYDIMGHYKASRHFYLHFPSVVSFGIQQCSKWSSRTSCTPNKPHSQSMVIVPMHPCHAKSLPLPSFLLSPFLFLFFPPSSPSPSSLLPLPLLPSFYPSPSFLPLSFIIPHKYSQICTLSYSKLQ